MIWLIAGGLILLFGAVVLRGAPYVPTLKRSVKNALDLLDLADGDLVIDLGSGDGNVLKAAAQRGYKALGYEINPLLCIISRLRALPQRSKITVLWRDFWLAEWPQETKAVFVFLAGPYMNHLSRKLAQVMNERKQPLIVISYGFAIPGYLPKKISNGFYLYELQPTNDPRKPRWNPRIPHPKLFRRK
ncbi:MAG TPA: hypothetical protein VLG40_01755 [Candidatus Saccharimonas sp.]|nr:hypothetical protein [Candidatus Saccharimonas sp.]